MDRNLLFGVEFKLRSVNLVHLPQLPMPANPHASQALNLKSHVVRPYRAPQIHEHADARPTNDSNDFWPC